MVYKQFYLFLLLILNAKTLCLLGVDCGSFDVKESIDRIELIDERENISFQEDYDLLAQLNLQMAIKKYNRNEFLASEFAFLDRDHTVNHLSDEEFITVAKTAIIYPNVQPSYFNSSRLMNMDFCKCVFLDDSRMPVGNRTIRSEKRYFVKKISALVHLSEYDFETGTTLDFPKKLAYSIKAFNHNQLPLKLLTSTHSDACDISTGSHGARTINLYYNFGDQHTLHISFRLLTFKKESWYSSFLFRPLRIWQKVNESMRESQIESSIEAFSKIRNYILTDSQSGE